MIEGALTHLHLAAQTWFREAFGAPTRAQALAWPSIAAGHSTLLLAPTGSGKTLAAFLVALDRLMFRDSAGSGTRVLYVSPLKALGVDVERNLRAPLTGLCAVAERDGHAFNLPSVGVRSGDTPQRERAQLVKRPPDILITTPESLYLMLTSQARETLRQVETVIVDEIHSLCGTKRGAHLMLSLERVELLRCKESTNTGALQRIGLSATQRPLDEVARFLGGSEFDKHGTLHPRRVEVVDAGSTKQFDLRVEVPVEDMRRPTATLSGTLTQAPPAPSNAGGAPATGTTPPTAPEPPSMWPAITPRLLELVRSHHSTMVFVNSRRLAERIAAAINELAETEVALAHHGSVAKDTRSRIEERLKRGELPAIIATSSMELGVDMGAVDLVVQIEAPPSVAAAMQRIGRAGHRVGEVSRGVLFPKFRGDLLPCATVVEHAKQGQVESTRYPRNPLDVLAQHIVSALVEAPCSVETLYQWVRRAAPFAELPRPLFDSVLDMLSGRYPSERFRELRPRINWDRTSGRLEARRGARLLAVSNPGAIVDRGLYGVYLAGTQPAVRVGELDEEMVFETRPGEVFLLGASSWRVEDISHDRVLVSPAPGQPGRMPFWRGDKPGRPLEFGRAIGQLTRQLSCCTQQAAKQQLATEHGLDERAASNLVAYLEEQRQHSALPTDRRIVVERFVDAVGDWRVVVLSPFGGRVHAPWSIVVAEKLRRQLGIEIDSMWADDGMVFRLPDSDEAPDASWFVPGVEETKTLLHESLGTTALFSAHFRENAARALLLPRRRPGKRMPLWVQRRRSSDLLSVASEFPDFPIVLETYRECLQDVFDMNGLMEILGQCHEADIETVEVTPPTSSPFAAALLFSYVGNFIYDGDAPLAERRAQALSLDHDQLRLLLGEPELRELLDADAILELERRLQRVDDQWPCTDADGLHDLLLELGDSNEAELALRIPDPRRAAWLATLQRQGRALTVDVAGEPRTIAAEDAARYRDALGVVLPAGVPEAFLTPVREPLLDLVLRFSKTHGPFSSSALAERYRLRPDAIEASLRHLERMGLVVRGAFLPGGMAQEYCGVEVLRRLKQSSLVKLRQQIEPVDPEVYTRFLLAWQHVTHPLRGLDGVLTVIEQLQGLELPYSDWVDQVLPQRVHDFRPHDLSELCAAGELTWRGHGMQAGDVRLSFYLTDAYSKLAPPSNDECSEMARRMEALLESRGALFFSDMVQALAVFHGDAFEALWQLVWCGKITNDTLAPAAALRNEQLGKQRGAGSARRGFRSRRTARAGTEGRWSLLPSTRGVSATERASAQAEQLVRRFGVLTREAVRGSGLAGGFAFVYPVLKALEEAGRLRRGYFIAGHGATQFAHSGAESQLRRHRKDPAQPGPHWLAAGDPANPYGVSLTWPEHARARPTRGSGSSVALRDGQLVAYTTRGQRGLHWFGLQNATALDAQAHDLAVSFQQRFEASSDRAWLLEQLDGFDVAELLGTDAGSGAAAGGDAPRAAACALLRALQQQGFAATPKGLQIRRFTRQLHARGGTRSPVE